MTIRKKSLTGTLRPDPEVARGAARPAPDAVQTPDARPAQGTMRAEDLALSKRTVSRILLAKSLFGR